MAVGIESDPSYCDEQFEETEVKVKVRIYSVLSRCGVSRVCMHINFNVIKVVLGSGRMRLQSVSK